MDVADAHVGQLRVKDEIGVRCQKLFLDFLEDFKEDGEIKYLKTVADLVNPDRSTLEVSFEDIEKYNQNLATTIIEEYYRIFSVSVPSGFKFYQGPNGVEEREGMLRVLYGRPDSA